MNEIEEVTKLLEEKIPNKTWRPQVLAKEICMLVNRVTATNIITMFADKNYITEKDLINGIAKRYGVKL